MQQTVPNLPSLQRQSRSKSKLKFSQMKRSQSQSCTVRSTIPSSHSRRYQNVQKIAMLIEDIKSKDLSKGQKSHQIVVEGFKQKIKNTFNELYGNYQQNKQIINYQIKNLQKNKTSHIEMTTKFQQTLKQKNQYDKLKLQVDIKNRKLIKLRQILKRQRDARSEKDILKEGLVSKINQLKEYQMVIDSLDYEKGVLENMRINRRVLKEALKKRFNEYYEEFTQKSRRINKFYNQNEIKNRLISDLNNQMPGEEVAIPQNFVIELQNKLEHLYGKEAFQNIFYHENIINQEINRQEREREIQDRQTKRKIKEQLQREQKRQLQRVQGEYIKNRQLQQKFLKQCGIKSLQQIIDYRTGQNREQLLLLKQQLQQQIKQVNSQTTQINNQIQKVLSQNQDIQITIRDIQKQYTLQHQQQKKLAYIANNNNKFLQSLQTYIDRITQQSGPIQDMNLKLAKFSSRLQRISQWNRDKNKNNKNSPQKKKMGKISELQIKKNQTENTVIMDKESEYLEEHIQSIYKK